MFANVYAYASAIRKGSNPKPRNITHCAYCREPTDPYKILRCSACHCIRYCSRTCQRLAWKGSSAQGGYFRDSHKNECSQIKVIAAELPEIQATLKQFPWARIEEDGAFGFELALAMRKLLGKGPKFGWWAMEERDPNLTLKKIMLTTGSARPPTLAWGSILLSEKHLDEKSGWTLHDEEIPWLSFGQGRAAPSFPPVFEHNWTSYYKWRGLPLKSIAALLLHWPLSIYRLLYLLDLALSETGERRKLNIHCLGIEAELNALPVFGELALLLPNTDIDIVMFGKCPYDIASKAKPHTLAAQKYAYEYRAPDQCGSGSIRIQLYKTSPIWSPVDILTQQMIPDVIIALNAGMSTYIDTWGPVFSASRALSIPFALTEFGRISLLEDQSNYETFAENTILDTKLSELLGKEKLQVLVKSQDYRPSSAINPFMRPGHLAAQSHSMPSAVNGFTCIVTPRLSTIG